MSLRDYFAAKTMQGIMANNGRVFETCEQISQIDRGEKIMWCDAFKIGFVGGSIYMVLCIFIVGWWRINCWEEYYRKNPIPEMKYRSLTRWRLLKDLPGCKAGTVGTQCEGSQCIEFNTELSCIYFPGNMERFPDFFERMEELKPSLGK